MKEAPRRESACGYNIVDSDSRGPSAVELTAFSRFHGPAFLDNRSRFLYNKVQISIAEGNS